MCHCTACASARSPMSPPSTCSPRNWHGWASPPCWSQNDQPVQVAAGDPPTMKKFLSALLLTAASATGLAAAPSVPAPPAVQASGYILLDHDSGRVLAEQRADERMEPASITKLMTAYIVFTAL